MSVRVSSISQYSWEDTGPRKRPATETRQSKGTSETGGSGTGTTGEAHGQVTCGEEWPSLGHTIQMAPLQPLRVQCGHVHSHWACTWLTS